MKYIKYIQVVLLLVFIIGCLSDPYNDKLKISNKSNVTIGVLLSNELKREDIVRKIKANGFYSLIIQPQQKMGYGINGKWSNLIDKLDGSYIYVFDYTLYKGFAYGNLDTANIERGILMKFKISRSKLDSCNWVVEYR